MGKISLQKSVYILLFLYLLLAGVYYARPFLVPVAFGALFATLCFPVSHWLEEKGIHKAIAILICIFLFLAVLAGIIALLYWQVSDLAKDAHQIEQNFIKKINELRHYISRSFGISEKKQEEFLNSSQSSSGLQSTLGSIFLNIGSLLTDFVLFLVYLFLFLYFRIHLKKFVLMLVAAEGRQKAAAVMENCSHVAQKYLSGMAAMIVCLWVLYSIGFSIVGVKNAIFFAILCGLLEIVPFVGNLTGNLITMLMAFAQGGSPSMILGILITYATIQFFQTYVLEPLVVGAGVDINPLFTIAGLVVGELVWGIPGMVLAIPVMGIAKIICDNVEGLKPYGFLLGKEKSKKGSPLTEKIKKWFKRKT